MPPFLPRKRLRSSSPETRPVSSESRANTASEAPRTARKPTVFDAIDSGGRAKRSAKQVKTFTARLAASDDDSSSLSSLSSSEPDFEDVPHPKRQRTAKVVADDKDEDEDEDDEDEDVVFEDVQAAELKPSERQPSRHNSTDNEDGGDLHLTLTKETRLSVTNPYDKKRAPTKIERSIRTSTHQMHVQFLMWHNTLRNGWICDREVQDILLKQLGPGVEKEISQWRRASGLEVKSDNKSVNPKERKRTKGKTAGRQAEWSLQADRQTIGEVDLSHGDPLFRLIKALTLFWKSRFRVTEPGLRKMGYMPLQTLDEVIKGFQNHQQNSEAHGECIPNIEAFREKAKICEGSRDLGAQLFTALLRGIGLESRMVVSLQPVGFGWSAQEEASEKKGKKSTSIRTNDDKDGHGSKEDMEKVPMTSSKSRKPIVNPNLATKAGRPNTDHRKTTNETNSKDAPINMSDVEVMEISDDDSVVDITPARTRRGPSKPYEKDLAPNYWSEVLSPVTKSWLPCSTLMADGGGAATNENLLTFFEPKGKKAEKAKQVMAYLIGYSSDGTAKDVTVRYLKRNMFPGKTKGMRMPAEKIPIYNRHGKIKRYEHYDWFKTVMSGYARRDKDRTDIDDQEEATDLKIIKPEKKQVKDGEETLASYKASDVYVLEKHMRREEALLPGTNHVKIFTAKMGKKGTEDHKVFYRKDVVKCKTQETWHKEGRAPKAAEEPLKRVPYRVATTNRRRELAEAEAATGEIPLQGLYSWDQTDWIIPPPIVDGIIPKNNFGNMDVYVPSMVPVGAIHIPYKGTVKVCKQLGIDYAEAVTGFEFGGRMAIPVITGVVVAEKNEQQVIDRWREMEIERVRKEDEKKRVKVLAMWRKFLMGLRILKRVREEYGDQADNSIDELNPWTNTKKEEKIVAESRRQIMNQHDEDMAGGFLPEGQDEEEPPQSFFPTRHESDDEGHDGGFVVEDEKENAGGSSSIAKLDELEGLDQTLRDKKPRVGKTIRESTIPKAASKLAIGPSRNARTANGRKPSSTPKSGSRNTSTSKSKQMVKIQNFEDDDMDDSEHGSEDLPVSGLNSIKSKKTTKPVVDVTHQPASLSKDSPATRIQPKRRAARSSETKSHYFEPSDDGDDDL